MTEGLDERLLASATATLELFSVYIGTRLNLYAVMAEQGAMNACRLAEAAGIDARYAREWLEQQAVAGLLCVDDATQPAEERTFALPAEHRGALVDVDDLAHLAPLAQMVVGVAGVLDLVVDAYRSGGGVPYRLYGSAFRQGQAGVNRPAFTSELTGSWLPAMPDLHERLSRPGARVADVGCGLGYSSIALAKAYPHAEIIGVDADAASIDEARLAARQAGVSVRFVAGDAAELASHAPFDAVLVLEALHDMARPVEVLLAARKALTDEGSLIVVDERVHATFTSPGDEIERFMYGWSVSHCLPASRAEQPSAALGTVLREDQVIELAADAGFSHTEVTDIEAGFFRVYRLHV